MLYLCECPKCGPYSVDRTLFETFISSQQKEELDERIRTQVFDVVRIKFQTSCIKCDPDSDHVGILQLGSEVEEE